MKFATKLTFFSLSIILIVAFAVSYAVYSTNTKIIEKQIKENFENLALHTMDKIDRMLFERYADIKILASDPIISSKDSTPASITKRLVEFRNNYKTYASLSFFDLNRIRISDTAGMHLGKQHQVVQWTIDSIDNGIVSAARDIRFAEELKKRVIYFSAPVRDDSGEAFGAVVARMEVSKLFDITREAIAHFKEKNLEVDLYDKNGLLLYSNHNRKGILKDNITNQENLEFGLEDKLGTLKDSKPGEDEIMFMVYVREEGFLDFQGNNWILTFHIPGKIVFSPLGKLRNKIITILAPIVIFSILMAFVFARSFSKPIQRLSEAAEKIGRGEMDVNIEDKSKDELGQLAYAFNQMSKDLRRSRNEFMAVIEGSTDAIFVKDIKGRYLMINSSGADMIGKPAKEIIGKDDMEVFPLEFAMTVMSHDREVVEKEESITYEEEVTVEGRKFHFLSTKGVYHDSNGKLLGIYGVARDVSELKKKAEELKKNNAELESFNNLAVGREIKMIDLKREVNELLEKLGQEKKYVIHKP